MHHSEPKATFSLGFLTVRSHPILGFVGGYLIVNELARPLEFHCTLPVQPTRAQQILYGTTLHDFVCGEQIGRALVTKAKCSPSLLIADTPSVLTLRHVHATPLASLLTDSSAVSLPFPSLQRSELSRFELIGLQFATLPDFRQDAAPFRETLERASSKIDLMEPFGRIEDALLEAHPATKAA
jgi:hypothetical protein